MKKSRQRKPFSRRRRITGRIVAAVIMAGAVGGIIAVATTSPESPESYCSTQMYDSLQMLSYGQTLYYGKAINGDMCQGLPESQQRAAWLSALKQDGINGGFYLSVTETAPN